MGPHHLISAIRFAIAPYVLLPVAGVGSLPAPKAGDGEHDRDDNDRRGVRYRSPRSSILRKTRGACDRCEPFHRMIGIYFRFEAVTPPYCRECRPSPRPFQRSRNLRQDRRPAAPAEMAIYRLPAVALVHIDHGLARLLIVDFSDDEVEG